jgi:hypothetical protein
MFRYKRGLDLIRLDHRFHKPLYIYIFPDRNLEREDGGRQKDGGR